MIVNIWKLSHPSLPQNHTLEYLDLSEDEPAEEGDDDGSKARLSKRAKLRRRFMNTRTTSPVPHGQESAKELKAEGNEVGDAPNASASTSGGGAAAVKKAAHKPTNCPCDMNKVHYSTVALDATYPAKPEKMYNLLFTSGFMKGFWTGNQKLTGTFPICSAGSVSHVAEHSNCTAQNCKCLAGLQVLNTMVYFREHYLTLSLLLGALGRSRQSA